MFQYSLTGKDGSGSGFGSWKTVPAVPVPLSVSGKTVPTVPVSGSGSVPEPPCSLILGFHCEVRQQLAPPFMLNEVVRKKSQKFETEFPKISATKFAPTTLPEIPRKISRAFLAGRQSPRDAGISSDFPHCERFKFQNRIGRFSPSISQDTLLQAWQPVTEQICDRIWDPISTRVLPIARCQLTAEGLCRDLVAEDLLDRKSEFLSRIAPSSPLLGH